MTSYFISTFSGYTILVQNISNNGNNLSPLKFNENSFYKHAASTTDKETQFIFEAGKVTVFS